VLMIHSFCENATGLPDFLAFFEQMGVGGAGRDMLSAPAPVGGVTLWVGWTNDLCPE